MPAFLSSDDQDFEAQFADFLAQKRESDADVDAVVAGIIDEVRARGDAVLYELTEKFDRFRPKNLIISEAEIDAAIKKVPDQQKEALELAAARIRSYHEAQTPADHSWQDDVGATLGWRWTPVDAAGIYVPGGLASYPSSVLMNAIPAKVAGVKHLAMCAPTPDDEISPLVLLAARLSSVDVIYRIGGAQAIAALAYGTQTVAPVDKITGPGNAFVAAAKRRVFGHVGIDMIAGPSEVLIIADKHNDPDWIAMDLMAQAEHDESAQSILITDDAEFGRAVAQSVENLLQKLERRAIAASAWQDYGALITVKNWQEAAELSNRIAPEHLEICTQNASELAEHTCHAGAIFIGAYTPEAIGDYVGGPNHVLPTARSARFSSGLSVMDFLKRTTISKMTPGALRAIGPSAETLAKAERLEAHGLSIRMRLDALNEAANG